MISAKLFPEDLKKLNLTKQEYEYLNPVTGFVWVEGGVLENYGELSQDSDLKYLINILFLRVDGFQPSILGANPAHYLHPVLIG